MRSKAIVALLLLLVGATVFANYSQQLAVDESKIPEKVEESTGFQRWLTNLKNKGYEVEADEFRLKEENEVFNLKGISVYSSDDPEAQELYQSAIQQHTELEQGIAFSLNNRAFLDYRNENRGNFSTTEVRYLGLRDDKIIDSKILTCNSNANCYFDRGYFLDNDVFVVSEISRNIEKNEDVEDCNKQELCTYTFKVHVVDLNNNERLVYESKPLEVIYTEIVPNL